MRPETTRSHSRILLRIRFILKYSRKNNFFFIDRFVLQPNEFQFHLEIQISFLMMKDCFMSYNQILMLVCQRIVLPTKIMMPLY